MNRIRPGNIIGRIVSAETVNEADHFYICGACKQAVDMRDLGAVFYHEDEGHEPLVVQ